MTQTPLERAARALSDKHGGIGDDWQYWLEDARVVLLAIREPSDAMCRLPQIGRDAEPWEIWQAMIDAALGE